MGGDHGHPHSHDDDDMPQLEGNFEEVSKEDKEDVLKIIPLVSHESPPRRKRVMHQFRHNQTTNSS